MQEFQEHSFSEKNGGKSLVNVPGRISGTISAAISGTFPERNTHGNASKNGEKKTQKCILGKNLGKIPRRILKNFQSKIS